MKRGIFVVITVLAVMVALMTTPAFGGKGCHERPAHAGSGGASAESIEKHDKHVAAFLAKYGEKIEAVYKEHEEKRSEIAERIEALKDEIDAIAKAEEPDLRELESALDKMSDLHFELTKLKFRIHKEARKLVDDEADRAGFDRYFAMEMGCCGGAGGHAECHSGHAVWKSKKADRSGRKAIFIGEKDGHAEVQILGDDDVLEWAPGTLGEKHVEVFVDDDADGVRRVKVLVDGEHHEFTLDDEDLDDEVHRIIEKIHATPGGLEHIKRGDHRMIKKVHKAPVGEFDDLVWTERGGRAGPF